MKVLGIAGWSGAGKTTLIEAMIPLIRARGLTVSTIKHAHHGLDIDRPGRDSHRHRLAGATEVLVASGARWALLRETSEPPPVSELLARLAPVDLVLIEGFKAEPHDKIEVYRPDLAKPPLWPGRPDIVAVASDVSLVSDLDVLCLSDPAAIVAWTLRRLDIPPGQGHRTA